MALVDQEYVCVKQNTLKFHDYLENGTISYLNIIGVALAIENFEKLGLKSELTRFKDMMLQVQNHLEKLTQFCVEKLNVLKHFNNVNLVEVYRKSKNTFHDYGPIIAFNLKNSSNHYIGYTLVDKLAQENKIHLRTGCFCNLGACQMFLRSGDPLKNFTQYGHKCGDHIDLIDGQPTGAIRISFGYCTIERDVELFLKFVNDCFIENKPSTVLQETSRLNARQQEYFKITSLYLYPVKSCASMKIENSWPLNGSQGLLYDRYWAITDYNGIVLTQKRLPLLTQLRPSIDLSRRQLILMYKNVKFTLNLGNLEENEVERKKQNVILNSMTNQVGYDEGDEVADWLTGVFELKEKCRLIKTALNNDSFANKSEYLLINERSIVSLRKHLINSLNGVEPKSLDKDVDEFLIRQFRANIVVNTDVNANNSDVYEFGEELWSQIKLLNKNVKFKVIENCTRCQMININQSTVILNESENEKYCALLLKQLYKLKLNSKFGIYLSRIEDEENITLSHVEASNITSQATHNLLRNRTSEISVGDIGTALENSSVNEAMYQK